MAVRSHRMETWAPSDAVFVSLLGVSATGFYVSPWRPIYAAFFLALAVLSFLRLQLALALVPAFAPFVMEPKLIGHLTFAPTELLIGLDVAIALLLVALRRAPAPNWGAIRTSPFLVPAAIFLVAVTISTVAATDRHLALHAYRERVIDPFAYYLLVLLFVRKGSDWYWLLTGLVAGGVVTGAISLGQYGLQRDLSRVDGTGIKRVQALYGSPDNLGLLLDRVIPIWFVTAMTVSRRSPGTWALWALGLLLIPPLILTYSLGAWIAVAVVCAGTTALLRPWGKWVVLAVLVIACAGLSVKYRAVEMAFQSGHSNSTQTRLDVWQSSWQMIRDRPLTGIGPDNFQRWYAPTASQDKFNNLCPPGLGYMQPGAGSEPCLSHPHDEFLDFWLSAGFLGLVSYVWLLFVFGREVVRLYRRNTAGRTRTLGLAVGAAMLASAIHGLVDNSYFLVDLSLLFWLFCAVVTWLRAEAPAPDLPLERRTSPGAPE